MERRIIDIAEDHSEAFEKRLKKTQEELKWIKQHPDEFNKEINKIIKNYERNNHT